MSFSLSDSLLDGFVLAVLEQKDTYAYELDQKLKESAAISETTLYPVLKRLQKEGYVHCYEKTEDGRNRRYYNITDDGRQKLGHTKEEWIKFRVIVDQFLGGETNG